MFNAYFGLVLSLRHNDSTFFSYHMVVIPMRAGVFAMMLNVVVVVVATDGAGGCDAQQR